jgi:hypothetical protein
VNETTTNTVTATGAFDDVDASAATDSDSATVTAHDCTITITKSPSVGDVCTGSDTLVTYTITVTNNSDLFDWTGDVVDDVLGDVALDVTIEAGDSVTYYPTHTVNETTTNTVTATGAFDDVDASAATDSDSATVTAHDCTITITKSPRAESVCNGSTVTYDYSVTNNSDYFTWSGTLSDDVLGQINGAITLDPGETEYFSAVGEIVGEVINTATASGAFDDVDASTATDSASATVTGYTCRIIVEKVTIPSGASQQFTFTGDLSGSIGDGGSLYLDVLQPGTYDTSETVPGGWDLTDITCDDADSSGSATPVGPGGTGTATYQVALGETVTCTFTNTERSMVNVLKLTDGLEDPAMIWTFKLYTGPDGFDSGTLLATDNTPPALLDFGGLKLDPSQTYTLCEENVAAGWTSEWKIDTDNDGIADTIVNPYNPNADDVPPQDLGNRCFDFGAGTSYTLTPGETLVFEVNNSFPGGEPRTPGYWKNWNACTGGNQVQVAANNGGPDEGWYTLDDLLNNPGFLIGDMVLNGVWDDDQFKFDSPQHNDCIEAVRILDKSDAKTGRKKANDAAYELATALLAAKLNLAAGAETCSAVQTAVNSAQTLLDNINFTGTGDYLGPRVSGPKVALRNQALALAYTLDQYNNGNLCP